MNKKENSSKYLSAMFENVSIIVLHFQKSLKPLAIHGFCVLLQRHKATVFTKDVKIKLESKAFHLFGGSPKVNQNLLLIGAVHLLLLFKQQESHWVTLPQPQTPLSNSRHPNKLLPQVLVWAHLDQIGSLMVKNLPLVCLHLGAWVRPARYWAPVEGQEGLRRRLLLLASTKLVSGIR